MFHLIGRSRAPCSKEPACAGAGWKWNVSVCAGRWLHSPGGSKTPAKPSPSTASISDNETARDPSRSRRPKRDSELLEVVFGWQPCRRERKAAMVAASRNRDIVPVAAKWKILISGFRQGRFLAGFFPSHRKLVASHPAYVYSGIKSPHTLTSEPVPQEEWQRQKDIRLHRLDLKMVQISCQFYCFHKKPIHSCPQKTA